MIKKILYVLLFSSISLTALEIGEEIPLKIQKELNIDNKQTYVLNFFASWCKSCKKELPLVNKVYDNSIASVIGVNVDKNEEDGKKFVAELALSFPVFYDRDKKIVEAFDPLGFPAIYYVKEGKILHRIFGAVDKIDKQIEKDMQEIK